MINAVLKDVAFLKISIILLKSIQSQKQTIIIKILNINAVFTILLEKLNLIIMLRAHKKHHETFYLFLC